MAFAIIDCAFDFASSFILTPSNAVSFIILLNTFSTVLSYTLNTFTHMMCYLLFDINLSLNPIDPVFSHVLQLSESLRLSLGFIKITVFLLDIEVDSTKELLDDRQDQDSFGEGDLHTVGLVLKGSWTVYIVEVGLV